MVLIEEIDRMLADWKVKLDLISKNLIDLCELLTYQRLLGTSGFSPIQLTGLTKNKVNPALEAFNELLEHFDLLSQTIDAVDSIWSNLEPQLDLAEAEIVNLQKQESR